MRPMTSTSERAPCLLTIRPDAQALSQASTWLTEHCQRQGVPEAQIQRLDLCLNEVLANLIEHAGPGIQRAGVDLELHLRCRQGEGQAALVVGDGGEPFDPLAFSPRPVPRSLEQAEPGGLGLVMLRSFSDELDYRRADGRNELRIGVHWPPRG
jgi:serine/threonine-protein kinase RsbW